MQINKASLSAVAIIANLQGKLLIVRERDNDIRLGKFRGQFSLPAGRVNNGENICHAAEREFREETGYTLADVSSSSVFTCYFSNREEHVLLARIEVFVAVVSNFKRSQNELTSYLSKHYFTLSRPPMKQIMEYWQFGEQRTELPYPFACHFEKDLYSYR